MTSLMHELGAKALLLGIPLSVQLDITYRCNERCVHCYLDHDDHGEMTTAEIKDLLDQLAGAGVFFLTISGGEILVRDDFFQILEYAREKSFCVKLKTNALMIGKKEADHIRSQHVESIQVSIYSHRPSVHDAITKVTGSFARSIRAIRFLREEGLNVIIANVLMGQNFGDYPGVRALAAELGVQCTIDPTITPMMDGNRGILNLGIDRESLTQVIRDPALAVDTGESRARASGPDEGILESTPCSAGHTSCYVSPYGDVYPCVQFPLPTGNVRQTKFLEIWNSSPQMNEVRSITIRDLSGCSVCVHGGTCTRCPGLAFMEGNMRGPSTADCEKSFARTGIPSENLKRKSHNLNFKMVTASPLVQIHS
ncbi:MAG TPA: radical SAM protein [Candidatus Acidoferrum sp.]|nr:radical SAM protein [Candidatus Acidoferrum sp.]